MHALAEGDSPESLSQGWLIIARTTLRMEWMPLRCQPRFCCCVHLHPVLAPLAASQQGNKPTLGWVLRHPPAPTSMLEPSACSPATDQRALH